VCRECLRRRPLPRLNRWLSRCSRSCQRCRRCSSRSRSSRPLHGGQRPRRIKSSGGCGGGSCNLGGCSSFPLSARSPRRQGEGVAAAAGLLVTATNCFPSQLFCDLVRARIPASRPGCGAWLQQSHPPRWPDPGQITPMTRHRLCGRHMCVRERRFVCPPPHVRLSVTDPSLPPN